MRRVRVLVSGHVQGVFFRASASDVAQRLGLTGWASNLPDGRVEAVFQGDDERVEEAVTFCHQGPPGARVDGVEVERAAPVDGEHGFTVR